MAKQAKPNILIIWGDDIGKDFPAVQKPGSFTIDDAMAKMSEFAGSS